MQLAQFDQATQIAFDFAVGCVVVAEITIDVQFIEVGRVRERQVESENLSHAVADKRAFSGPVNIGLATNESSRTFLTACGSKRCPSATMACLRVSTASGWSKQTLSWMRRQLKDSPPIRRFSASVARPNAPWRGLAVGRNCNCTPVARWPALALASSRTPRGHSRSQSPERCALAAEVFIPAIIT